MKKHLIRSMIVVLVMLSLVLTSASAQSVIPLPPGGGNNTITSTGEGEGNQNNLPALSGINPDHQGKTIQAAEAGLRAPTNDNLANATPISVPFSITEPGIETATVEPGTLPFCWTGGGETDVWFKLTIDTTITVDISTSTDNYGVTPILHAGPPNATQLSQLSFMSCNSRLYYDTLDLYGVTLEPGTYYLEVWSYGTVADPTTFGLDVQPAFPQEFNYDYPGNGTYAAAPPAYRWTASDQATSYDFWMYSNGGTTWLYNLSDLTPAVDGDGLVCDSELCTFTPTADQQAMITDGGSYEWDVAANNDGGTRPTDWGDHTFSTDFSQPPFPLSPIQGDYIVVQDPVQYLWEPALDAETYSFSVNQYLPVEVPGVINLTNLTPGADDDGLICDLDLCTLTLAPASLLSDGAIYLWIITGDNSNGSSFPEQESFIVDFTPVPGYFSLHDKYPPLYNVNQFSSFHWEPSQYAETYNLLINRTAPDNTVIVNAIGLTPAADGDALTCDPAYNPDGDPDFDPDDGYSCTYYRANAVSLFTSGEYNWTVSAVNANGLTLEDDTPSTFAVDTSLAFDLLTPANNAAFASGDDLTSFSWQQINAGGFDDFWTMRFASVYGVSYSYGLDLITEAADNDALTCTGGVCTLAATGSQLGMRRNQFTWQVNRRINYNGHDQYLNSSIWKVGVGAIPTHFQVANGSFETYNGNKLPKDWKVKGTLLKSKVKCDKPGKDLASAGSCAWFTKGVVGNGGIAQTLDTTGLLAGDTIQLNSDLFGKNVTPDKATVQMKVKLADNSKTKLILTATSSSDYLAYQDQVELSANPIKAKLIVKNGSSGGKLYVDVVYVNAILRGSAAPLLPLPQPLALPSNTSSLSGTKPVPDAHIGRAEKLSSTK
ncbi:MAG TPA: hypothetical protein VHL11_23315 [Phototrophicaceae bacterium]|jgi:hypothetical protein|nr:hypothetical protein [Phototrophicaceae bacterium]